MKLPAYLFDTDMLSEILKQKHEIVTAQALTYLANGGTFVFSIITYYEVRRGLLFKGAHSQLKSFDQFCQHGHIVPLTMEIVNLAAELWATRRKQAGGHPPNHDTLIAATALVERRIVVTGNERDFAWVPTLRLEDWRKL